MGLTVIVQRKAVQVGYDPGTAEAVDVYGEEPFGSGNFERKLDGLDADGNFTVTYGADFTGSSRLQVKDAETGDLVDEGTISVA